MTHNKTLVTRKRGNSNIRQREDAYLSATDICQFYGKLFADWIRLSTTASYLDMVRDSTGIPVNKLVQIHKGGVPARQGTWVHPLVAEELKSWATKKCVLQPERAIQNRIIKKLGGKPEVRTRAGAIDILTPTELIEIKSINNWKTGVGQLMVFGIDCPDHQKRLHLFGNVTESALTTIRDYCEKLGIIVTHENE
jgi:hypothetical protein